MLAAQSQVNGAEPLVIPMSGPKSTMLSPSSANAGRLSAGTLLLLQPMRTADQVSKTQHAPIIVSLAAALEGKAHH